MALSDLATLKQLKGFHWLADMAHSDLVTLKQLNGFCWLVDMTYSDLASVHSFLNILSNFPSVDWNSTLSMSV